MKQNIIIYGKTFTIRHLILAVLFSFVCLVQLIPQWGMFYSQNLYPRIAFILSSFSDLLPFAIGDLFIALSLIGLITYPVYAHYRQKKKWKNIWLNNLEYLIWIYVWFYIAWGLNYSRPNFFQRTGIVPVSYTSSDFQDFVNNYIEKLNNAYTKTTSTQADFIQHEVVSQYHSIADSLAIHHPFHQSPQAKTMLFTPLISMVGVTGSMGPFFCEFTLNGDLLPLQYPATYAHELAHRLGISSEAEANFYAYQVCTRSQKQSIRFSGYFSILGHVLSNAYRLMPEEDYKKLLSRIRPEIIEAARQEQQYWSDKYSPIIGKIQNWIYDLYLRGNKIKSGRKNYSEVIGLIISYDKWKDNSKK